MIKPALIGALAGALVAAGASFYLTRAVYQRQALKAQKDIAELTSAIATARSNLLEANFKLNNVLLEERNAKQKQMDGIANNLNDLGSRVQVCARKSDVSITLSPTGTIETVSGGQQRDLAEAVRELAQACVIGRDRDAIDHNKLIDWFQRLPKVLEAK